MLLFYAKVKSKRCYLSQIRRTSKSVSMSTYSNDFPALQYDPILIVTVTQTDFISYVSIAAVYKWFLFV